MISFVPNYFYLETKCSKSCGGGTQTRPVTCRDHLGQTLPDHRCHPSGRPEYSQSCHTDPCPTAPPVPEKTYRWKTASWTTVGELSSTTTETTFSDDANSTSSLTMESFFSSTFDSIDDQTTTMDSTTLDLTTFTTETYPITIPGPTLTPAAYPSPNPPQYATFLTSQISTVESEPKNTTTITDIIPSTTTSAASTLASTTDLTVQTVTAATTANTPTTTAISTTSTTTTTEITPSILPSTQSTVTLEPRRPVTFDWNSYTSPAGSFTSSSRYLSTSASARLFPVSLPHRPTYAYFANYYRFDSPTVRHSRRPH